ncbi:MAG: hypothetical protein V3V59_05025 [Thermodesulfovibrionales bacterium]
MNTVNASSVKTIGVVYSASIPHYSLIHLSVIKNLQSLSVDISDDENDREVLSKFGAKGFKKTSIDDFEPVYELLDKTGVSVADYNYKIE